MNHTRTFTSAHSVHEVMTEAPDQHLLSLNVAILSNLFDSAPDVAFFVKDSEGRYVAVNDSLVKRHGLADKSEAVGKRSRDICQGELGQVPSEQDEEVLRTGKPLLEHLEMQWSRHNEPVWCITTKLPIPDEKGKIVGLVGFSRDVRVPVQTDEIPESFAGAIREFESMLGDNMTPAVLAEQSGMTSQQLNRFTKKIFGLTPTQLITRTRIAAASRLLREVELTVAEIATTCGFYDHSAFTRAFKNATGLTPSEYRNQETG